MLYQSRKDLDPPVRPVVSLNPFGRFLPQIYLKSHKNVTYIVDKDEPELPAPPPVLNGPGRFVFDQFEVCCAQFDVQTLLVHRIQIMLLKTHPHAFFTEIIDHQSLVLT